MTSLPYLKQSGTMFTRVAPHCTARQRPIKQRSCRNCSPQAIARQDSLRRAEPIHAAAIGAPDLPFVGSTGASKPPLTA